MIWLDEGSKMTIYRNDYDSTNRRWSWPKITSVAIDLNAQNRNDMRFADVDGDQKADALWVHPSDGTTVAWLNRDPATLSGWARSVPYPNTIDPSHAPTSGNNIFFARIAIPYGRADYVVFDPQNNAVTAWTNGCNNYASGSSSSTDQANSGNNANAQGIVLPPAKTVSYLG